MKDETKNQKLLEELRSSIDDNNRLFNSILERAQAYMEDLRRTDAIVFFCKYGKFPDEV